MFHSCLILVASSGLATSSTLPSCSSLRPGMERHRTLRVAPEVVFTRPSNDTWTDSMCCVYTWVVQGSQLSPSTLTTYDGGLRSYYTTDWNSLMAEVMADICDMPMGSTDCRNCQIYWVLNSLQIRVFFLVILLKIILGLLMLFLLYLLLFLLCHAFKFLKVSQGPI